MFDKGSKVEHMLYMYKALDSTPSASFLPQNNSCSGEIVGLGVLLKGRSIA